MATNPKLEARITVAANSFGVSVDGGATTYIPAGDYYWSSDGPASEAPLITALETLIDATLACTVSISATTGKLTVTFSSGTHTVAFSSTTFRDLCGFAADMTLGAGAFTGTKQVRGLWLPGVLPGNFNAPSTSLGRPSRRKAVTRSESGKVWSVSLSDPLTDLRVGFFAVTAARAWTADEATVNESYQTFWTDYIGQDTPFRFYTDAADDTSYLVGSDAREYDLSERSASDFDSQMVEEPYEGLWTIALEGHLYVEDA